MTSLHKIGNSKADRWKKLARQRLIIQNKMDIFVPRMKQHIEQGKPIPKFITTDFEILFGAWSTLTDQLKPLEKSLNKRVLTNFERALDKEQNPNKRQALETKRNKFIKLIC